MGNDRKFRALAIAAICVAIVGVSVAYAALSASLSVTGTATVDTGSSWSVTANNATCTATGAAYFGTTAEKTKTFNITGTSLTWDATFTAPKDKVTCTFTWTNGGSIDAAITKVIASTGSESYASNFTYNVKMGDTTITGTTIANKYLKAKTAKDVTIEVIFDKDGELTELPSEEETVTFTAAFEFAQADSSQSYTEM